MTNSDRITHIPNSDRSPTSALICVHLRLILGLRFQRSLYLIQYD
ncbi:hypothetical protein [Dolichospermum sp. UHCC 0259]|nr:hypothetical protein [Dolichospermum sp. UHCC 0259]